MAVPCLAVGRDKGTICWNKEKMPDSKEKETEGDKAYYSFHLMSFRLF